MICKKRPQPLSALLGPIIFALCLRRPKFSGSGMFRQKAQQRYKDFVKPKVQGMELTIRRQKLRPFSFPPQLNGCSSMVVTEQLKNTELNCRSCGTTFVFTIEEQEFFQ